MSPVLRIFLLWRRQAGWLLFGTLLFLASLAAGLALMGASGRYIALSLLGGAVLVPAVLQYIGAARVVLRYLERVFTHEAMFRALAGLRIWLFTGLARSAAGGLGYRRAGDALARLVNDVDALDGLLLRIFLPLLGAVLMTPVLALLLWHEQHWALAVLAPFAFVAFYLPMLAARAAAANGARAGLAMSGLRSAALDALSGLREVKIYAAEGRMLAAVQAREAAYLAAQRELVGQTSALNAVAFVVAQAGLLLAMLIGISGAPVITIITVFVLITAFETVLGLPRAAVWPRPRRRRPRGGSRHRRAASPGPRSAGANAGGQCHRLRACQLPLRRRPAVCVREPVAATARRVAYRHSWALGCGEIHGRGVAA
jgi:ATP-binding cassette subfamily C protein CydC